MLDFYSIGLMSGSSLDGLDLCYSKISQKNESYHFEILAAETIGFEADIYEKLKNARDISGLELHLLDIELGKQFGLYCQEFIQKYRIEKIDAISNHGHTVFHFPEKGLSLQIANNNWIAQRTQLPVFGNLRMKNITLGGQGAPIVPIADKFLFSEYTHCINLGGISNITIENKKELNSFDICVCNQLLNYLSELLHKKFDANGDIASEGKVNQNILNALNNIDFYDIEPPKSIDNGMLRDRILPIIQKETESVENLLATSVEHIAIQIAKYLEIDCKTLITGGGAYNRFLISRIQYYSKSKIHIPDVHVIDFKEALAMSFMAMRSIEKKPNVLASTSGATKDSISGEWFYI